MLDRWPKFKPFPLNVTKKCQCCKVRNAHYLIDSFGAPYCKKTLCPLNSNTFNNNAPRVCIFILMAPSKQNSWFTISGVHCLQGVPEKCPAVLQHHPPQD